MTILVVMTDVLVTQRKASSMLYILPVKTNLVKRQTNPQYNQRFASYYNWLSALGGFTLSTIVNLQLGIYVTGKEALSELSCVA